MSQARTLMDKDRTLGFTLLISIAVVASGLLAVSNGSANIGIGDAITALSRAVVAPESGGITERIIVELRVPRVLLALVCGMGLALSGAVLQSVTRNPLADPFLFGISSGASLGAVIAITGGFMGLSVSVAAFSGSLLSVAIIMVLARDGQIERLILAGVAISFLFGSVANLILYFSDGGAVRSVLFWSLGSFARATWSGLLLPVIVVLIAITAVQLWQRHLQAMMAGDESAHTQGVAVVPLRLGMLLLTAVVTAALVAQCGGIGFVGLMVPHISRMLIGVGGRFAMAATALLGGLLMIWVDLISRWILPQQELPVGVLTAILGSLFFVCLLLKRRLR